MLLLLLVTMATMPAVAVQSWLLLLLAVLELLMVVPAQIFWELGCHDVGTQGQWDQTWA